MDLIKLKIDAFNAIRYMNFPDDIDIINNELTTPEVIIYYIHQEEDINKFVDYCQSISLPQDNRVIMVYKKGQKTVNRDIIITPFKNGTYDQFKMKAPMLCSLNKTLSAFVMMKNEVK